MTELKFPDWFGALVELNVDEVDLPSVKSGHKASLRRRILSLANPNPTSGVEDVLRAVNFRPQLQYVRKTLASPPAFGIYVGNLNQVAKDICLRILPNSTPPSSNNKDTLPFICVVNPPRHGKSLLLDTLFADDQDRVLVIPITYNSDTSFVSDEVASVNTAKQYFWLRVLRSLLGIPDSLSDLFARGAEKRVDWTWEKVQDCAIRWFQINPFNMSSSECRRHVVICVDEFSKLTDRLGGWGVSQRKDFITSLQNCKSRSLDRVVQFVFTGFNQDMTDLLGTSAAVDKHVLKICDLSSSIPLLGKIVNCYAHARSGKPIPVPLPLLECVKCTPGLVGLWAERVSAGTFDPSISLFCDRVQWLRHLTTTENLLSNWETLLEYLKHLETDYFHRVEVDCRGIAIGRKLVQREMGVGVSQRDSCEECQPQVIPICLAFVASQLLSSTRLTLTPTHRTLAHHLVCALNAGDSVSPGDEKNGKSFEVFCFHALQARLLLRHSLISTTPASTVATTEDHIELLVEVKIPLQSLIPSRVFLVRGETGQEALLHAVFSKKHLLRFLLPPLYFALPVGYDVIMEKIRESGASANTGDSDDAAAGVDEKCHLSQASNWVASSEFREISTDRSPCCVLKAKRCFEEMADAPFVRLFYTRLTASRDEQFSFRARLKSLVDEKEGVVQHLEKKSIATLISCSTERKTFGPIISAMDSLVKAILCSESSIFRSPRDAEGCDLVMVWQEAAPQLSEVEDVEMTQQDDDDDDDLTTGGQSESMRSRSIFHVAAVELKDRRSTSPEELQAKVDSLTSWKCIVWWVQEVFSAHFKVKFHIVIAGRENN